VILSAVSMAAVKQQVTVVGSSSFVVPSGVSRMTFKLWGAGGASTGVAGTLNNGASFAGGSGAFVSCDITVTPGTTMYLLVGQGGLVNGFSVNTGNAQGGGGKLTFIILITLPDSMTTLKSRIWPFKCRS
jgi:hypothetical protein